MTAPIHSLIDAAVTCVHCGATKGACACNVRPFSNGTEFYDWSSANCDRCQRNGPFDPASGKGPCPMETALSRGMITGTIPSTLALQYGATNPRVSGNRGYIDMPRQCSQFAPPTTCERIHSHRPASTRHCGKPATGLVVHKGLTMAVCAKCTASYRRVKP